MMDDHPTWLEIDQSAVFDNCTRVLGDAGKPLMAVLKGDAYGHGAAVCGEAALAAGAAWLGVARGCEALSLRQAGIRAPLLVLGAVAPGEVDELVANEVTLTLHSPESLALYAGRSRALGRAAKVHLKLDTGLGRLGIFPDQAVDFARQAAQDGLAVDGVFSHLACAEEPHNPLNALQIGRFRQALEALQSASLRPRWAHLANSAGVYALPEAHFDMLRAGNLCLGLRISLDDPLPPGFRPAMTWKARLAACRRLPPGWGVGYGSTYITQGEEWIGAIPVGYGDGLRRVPGNRVLIGGQSFPTVGRLSLDSLAVRLPRAYPVGEEVVIIGRQGEQEIGVHDLAGLYGVTQSDLCTHIHARVPRLVVNALTA